MPLRDPRRAVPGNRYVMAGGCYRLRGMPVHFQATDLSRYLPYSPGRRFLTGTATGAVTWEDRPSAQADWVVRGRDGRFTFTLPGRR